MQTYQELLDQRAELDRRIDDARREELSQVIAEIRTKVDQYEITAEDIFGRQGGSKKAGFKSAIKYRNPVTGQVWTGRGKPPNWIKDQNRDQFLI